LAICSQLQLQLQFQEAIAHGQKPKRVIIDYMAREMGMGMGLGIGLGVSGGSRGAAGQTSGCYYHFVLSLTLAVPLGA